MFKTEKLNLEKIRTGLQQDHVSFQISLTSQITELQDDLAMENKVMDSLAKKIGKSFDQKQGGEGSSKEDHTKVHAKPVFKKESKVKEKLIEEKPIIDDDEDEEPNEVKLKRKKARDAELNEAQRIIKEAEKKERAEKEAQATLKSRMLLFPNWTLKKIQRDVVDMPDQYWLDPVASFDRQNT
ncbi:unnamed protein product [Lactuca saligna]|uniref:Uncharacterized protein n=1 Tax=Lactuca saligna TaxID=75948 RepID=A0AA35ZE22_LACSI|nr:unnamed protein product [Lactuca saligna]